MNPFRSIAGVLVVVALAGALAASPLTAAARDVSGSSASAAVADQPAAPASLYKRLGGYDAIAALTDDFIGRLATDPRLSKFFTGLNDTSKARVRQHVVDLLCHTTGGPCVYLGQDMKPRTKASISRRPTGTPPYRTSPPASIASTSASKSAKISLPNSRR